MLIESKLIRKYVPNPALPAQIVWGTFVTMGKSKDARHYHFKPKDPARPEEAHVCDVTHEGDLARFLAIQEGYRIHSATAATVADDETDSEEAEDTGGSATAKDVLLDQVEAATGKRPAKTTSVAKLQAMLAAK